MGPEVAAERVAVGQVHQGLCSGAGYDQKVARLTPACRPVVQEAVGHQEVVGGEALLWLLVHAVNQMHMDPGVPQLGVLLLFAPKVPFPRDTNETGLDVMSVSPEGVRPVASPSSWANAA